MQDIFKIYQIPSCILKKMSTQAVIQAIWEHPLFTDLLERGQYQADFEALFSGNNAYLELTAREDAGAVLLERLTLVDPLCDLSQAFDVLMSQPVFLSQLNEDEKKAVVSACVRNNEMRKDHRFTENLLSGRTLLSAGYTPFIDIVNKFAEIKSFLDNSEMNDAPRYLPTVIIHCSRKFLGADHLCENPSLPTPCEEYQSKWIGMNMPRPADSYNYPLCSPEWGNSTAQERLDADEVPVCVLDKMSTQAVIQAIWESWGFSTILVYHSSSRKQLFIEGFLDDSAACIELITRNDAGTALLERLDLMDPSFNHVYLNTANFELIIAQPVFLSQLNSSQKRNLIEICQKHDDLQKDKRYSYREVRFLLIGRAMYADGYAPFVEFVNSNEYMEEFLFDRYFSYSDYNIIPPEIFNFVNDYLNKN